ncbi:hypothetical protein CapIbe_009224 [Capra ibex]
MQPVGDGDFASKREGRSLVIRQIQAAQQELFLAVGARQVLKMVVGAQREPSHCCVQRPGWEPSWMSFSSPTNRQDCFSKVGSSSWDMASGAQAQSWRN